MSMPGESGSFYKIDSTRVTFREYMLESKNPLVLLIAAVLKGLRVVIPSYTDDVPTPSLGPHRVEILREDIQEKVVPLVAEFLRLGFGGPAYHEMEDGVNLVTTGLVTLLHPSGAVGRVHLRRSHRFSPPKEKVFAEVVTPLAGGGFVWTISGKPDLLAPPECLVERHVEAGVETLWGNHQKRVEGLKAGGRTAAPVRDERAMLDVMERLHEALWAFHTKRGVFRPATAAEEAALTRTAPVRASGEATTAGEAGTGQVRHAAVLQEIDAIMNKKGTWAGALWLLGITLVLFLVVGRGAWEFKDLLYLVPILFIHELGHYLTMRAFGYKNLRMFFIPFLGAAVTGRNYNVAGWKKVVVSLAGPVPGIVLGILLGIWGLMNQKPEAVHVAGLALVINGFNLLPMMPLDGGHVMHALLFSRHYLLDVAFRVIAAVLMIGLGLVAGGALVFVGVMMLMGIPAAYRVSRIAYDLGREGVGGASADGQTIPPALAEKIIDRVNGGATKPQSVKIVAQQTLTVFEHLNARPPGVLGTLGLLGAHGGTFAAALAAGVVFIVAQNNVFKTAFQEEAMRPVHAAPADVDVSWRGEKFEEHAADQRSVIATFSGPEEAGAAAKQVAAAMPATAAVLVFGDSVIVVLPGGENAARDAAFKMLEGKTEDVYVEHAEQESTARFSGTAPGEAQAQALVEELQASLQMALRVDHLAMPWHVGLGVTQEQYEQALRVRRTVKAVEGAAASAFEDAEVKELQTRMGAARRRGATAELAALQVESIEVQERVGRSRVEALRSDATLEQWVVAEMLAASATQPAHPRWALPESVRAKAGVLPPGAEAARRTGVRWGWARHNGLFVDLRVTVPEFRRTAPALLKWLQARGVQDVRYDLMGTPSRSVLPDGEEE